MSKEQAKPIFPLSAIEHQFRLRDYFAEERKRLEDECAGLQLPVSSQPESVSWEGLTFDSDTATAAQILSFALCGGQRAAEGPEAAWSPGYALLGVPPNPKLDALRLPGSSKAAAALIQLLQLPAAQQVAAVWVPKPEEAGTLGQLLVDMVVKEASPGLTTCLLPGARDVCFGDRGGGSGDPRVRH